MTFESRHFSPSQRLKVRAIESGNNNNNDAFVSGNNNNNNDAFGSGDNNNNNDAFVSGDKFQRRMESDPGTSENER